MADKNWTEKLRQKMSEYTETPPSGLWEGIESAAGLGGKTAAGGFWAWLTSRPALWPVWATAGAAAAVAALLLLRTPAAEPVTPGPDLPSTVIAQTETEEDNLDVTTVMPDLIGHPETDAPAVIAGAVEKSHPAPAAKEASTVMPDPIGHPETDDSSVISDEPSVISSEAEKSAPYEPESASEPQESIPVWTPNSPGTTSVPISSIKKRNRPLFAASLVGTNAPNGSTVTSNPYGFTKDVSYHADASPLNPTMSMLGRNKSVQKDVSHRQDYQFGVLLSYALSERWALESGVTLTGLSSTTTESTGSITRTKKESFTYIGVPVRVVFYPLLYKSFSVYTSLGPAVEYGLKHSWASNDMVGDKEIPGDSDSTRPGDWVYSASLNAGVQWQPWNYGAFFIQPGVVGRLVSENSPESFYTTHPVSFQLAAGYKITF